ncbi:hypothetical protein HDU97_009663 [Phlyctochytrium planicorne]|nr:hypothetical protein HDU97_009663 [Phlyctochytrium planicorne]
MAKILLSSAGSQIGYAISDTTVWIEGYAELVAEHSIPRKTLVESGILSVPGQSFFIEQAHRKGFFTLLLREELLVDWIDEVDNSVTIVLRQIGKIDQKTPILEKNQDPENAFHETLMTSFEAKKMTVFYFGQDTRNFKDFKKALEAKIPGLKPTKNILKSELVFIYRPNAINFVFSDREDLQLSRRDPCRRFFLIGDEVTTSLSLHRPLVRILQGGVKLLISFYD